MQEAALAEDAPKNPELNWIRRYFAGISHPFNGFGRRNDHIDDQQSPNYYDPKYYSQSAVTRACVSVEWVAFSEIAQDSNMVYVPCGISSGLRVHEALDRKNKSNLTTPDYEPAVTSYKAEEYVGPRQKNIMAQNRDDNLRRARIVGRMQTDSMVVAPVVREGAVRALNDMAFARGKRYEEEDFMAFWYPVIDRCKGMVLDGDWNFSRNSIWEMMRGVLIQSGQIPSRPKADMDVVDLEGNPVTLLARAEKAAEMLKYQLGKGFEPREAATALAQIFTLDDKIRAGEIPDDHLHEVLKHRPPSELNAMKALEAEIKPILLHHCAHLMRLDDLPQEYRDAAKAEPRKLTEEQQKAFSEFADKISADELGITSVKVSDKLKAKTARVKTLPRRQFDNYERFFEKDSRATMFEDKLYDRLAQWEKIALPFAIGATETGLYPTAEPMATAIFTDLKRGERGFRIASLTGVHNMDEFAGSQGRSIAEVISKNTADADALKAELKAENPAQIVVNTPSFLRIADAIDQERPNGFVAAPGASKTSPQMRLALQMKYLDRNVGRAVFQEGWQYSNDLVQLRVRARMIQAGLVERPAGDQSLPEVYTAGENKTLTQPDLLDDIRLLTAEVDRAIKHNVRVPEQALALARLVTLHELVVDPSLRQGDDKQTRDIINTLNAPDSLTCYNRQDAKDVTAEAKKLLKEKAALWIPYERLYVEPVPGEDPNRAAAKTVQNQRMQDYIDAQQRLQAEEAAAKRLTPQSEIHVRREGAQR